MYILQGRSVAQARGKRGTSKEYYVLYIIILLPENMTQAILPNKSTNF